MTLFRRSCEAKVFEACTLLGVMYASGTGTRVQMGRAATLFKLSCNGGEPKGCEMMRKVAQHRMAPVFQ